eukprot:c2269_g1_i1.p1 GENE.c2269_g1_i1~~c2269_g1_i1.p1  ORF type:complete len:481 (-),score=136.56 c2269_g1_i1:30-1472(-)
MNEADIQIEAMEEIPILRVNEVGMEAPDIRYPFLDRMMDEWRQIILERETKPKKDVNDSTNIQPNPTATELEGWNNAQFCLSQALQELTNMLQVLDSIELTGGEHKIAQKTSVEYDPQQMNAEEKAIEYIKKMETIKNCVNSLKKSSEILSQTIKTEKKYLDQCVGVGKSCKLFRMAKNESDALMASFGFGQKDDSSIVKLTKTQNGDVSVSIPQIFLQRFLDIQTISLSANQSNSFYRSINSSFNSINTPSSSNEPLLTQNSDSRITIVGEEQCKEKLKQAQSSLLQSRIFLKMVEEAINDTSLPVVKMVPDEIHLLCDRDLMLIISLKKYFEQPPNSSLRSLIAEQLFLKENWRKVAKSAGVETENSQPKSILHFLVAMECHNFVCSKVLNQIKHCSEYLDDFSWDKISIPNQHHVTHFTITSSRLVLSLEIKESSVLAPSLPSQPLLSSMTLISVSELSKYLLHHFSNDGGNTKRGK